MRVYQCGEIEFNSEAEQNLLSAIAILGDNLYKTDEEWANEYFVFTMNQIRKRYGIPNKILKLMVRNSDKKMCLVVFDHEPLNKTFAVKFDENRKLYIDIPELEECKNGKR